MFHAEGEPKFVVFVLVFREEFVFADESVEGGWCDLVSLQQSLFDAESIDRGFVGGLVVEVGFGGIEGFEELFGGDFAGVSFVFACLCGDPCDAVIFVVVEPGLDGAPGELSRVAFFVEEGHGGDIADAFASCSSVDGVDGSEDAHLEVDGRLFHE